MSERLDVFISSTSKDLTRYRQRVDDVVMKIGMHPIMMEDFNPSDANAMQVCYDRVQDAEVFIGIYALRYGYIPGTDSHYKTDSGEISTGDGKTSVTHWEYLWAKERGIPIRLFVLAEVYPSGHESEGEPIPWPHHKDYVDEEPGKSALQVFKAQIMKDHVVAFYHSPDDLASKVLAALADIQNQRRLEKPANSVHTRTRSDFYKHIALPTNYVPRLELLAELRLALLGDASSVALTSAVKRNPTALHGLGGIGKSVMARALCDDPVVQAAFPDGILWTTLGSELSESDLIRKLREWVEALGGTIGENVPSLDSLKSKLVELLETRTCLLIVDDVWQRKHADSFRVVGEKSRFLLTTRDAEIARSLGAEVRAIPAMSLFEATALLEEWAAGTLASTPADLKEQIVNRLGRLPLAVKLAGAQLQKKAPQDWLDNFQARKLKSMRLEDVHDSLEQTFGLSLDALDASTRKLYAALAIFREDEPIREMAITRLWEALDTRNTNDSQELVDDLAARALLEVVGAEFPRAVVLHDLLRNFMDAELGEARLHAHQRLIDSYRATQIGQGWYTAPDDGYLYDHLAYHLYNAGKKDELHQLLTSTPQWMEAKFIACQGDASYLSDLNLLLKDYADPLAPEQIVPLTAIVSTQQVVHARVNIYTDTDLKSLVYLGRTAEALTHARLRVDNKDRVDGLIAIYQAQSDRGLAARELLDEALNISRTIEVAIERAESLRTISEILSQNGDSQAVFVLEQALNAAHSIEDYNLHEHDYTLRAIADSLFGLGQIEPALSAAHGIGDAAERAEALRAIAVAMEGSGHPEALSAFDQALDAAYSIEDAAKRAEALRAIAAAMEESGRLEALSAFDQALDAAHSIKDATSRNDTVRVIIETLLKSGQIEQALNIVRDIEYAYWRATVLRVITTVLAQSGQVEQALSIAHTIENLSVCGDALRDIVDVLIQNGQIEQALNTAHAIEDSYFRVTALHTVAVALAQNRNAEAADILEQALSAARTIEESYLRAAALRAIANALAQNGSLDAAVVFEEALSTARTIEDAHWRAIGLETIADSLAQRGENEQALSIALTIEETESRANALLSIAIALALSGQSERAISVAHSIEELITRDLSLAEIAETLIQSGQIEQALYAARSIENEYRRADALRDIAAALTQSGQIEQALSTAHSIASSRWQRANALKAIPSTLTQSGQIEQAISIAYRIEEFSSRAESLRDIAAILTQTGQIEQALSIARSIEDAYFRANALSNIIDALIQSGQIEEALNIARSSEDSDERATNLRAIAVHMAQCGISEAVIVFEEVLNAARAVEYPTSRANALCEIGAALVQRGDPNASVVFELALNAAGSIDHPISRASALSNIVKALSQHAPPNASAMFKQAVSAAYAIDGRNGSFPHVAALCEVAGAMAAFGHPEAVSVFDQALSIANKIDGIIDRASALKFLAPNLAQSGQTEQALSIAQSIEDASGRADVLCGIATVMAQRGAPDAGAVLEQALSAANSIDENVPWRAGTLGNIAISLAQNGQIDQAISIAHSIESDSAWGAIASVLAQSGQIEQALRICQGDDSLRAIAAAMAQNGQTEQALSIALSIESTRERVDALCDVAIAMAQRGHPKVLAVFEEALSTARTIKVWGFSVLGEVVAAMARQKMLQSAFSAMGAYDPDVYLQNIAQWSQDVEKRHPGYGIAMLCEAVRIIAWAKPSWQPIYEILAGDHNG